uniref:Major facilitator superfamily associated domain-containing protein n=1 Tax=Anopheles stephensi TaxID=30069 RepID=A0A182Y645_ANOST
MAAEENGTGAINTVVGPDDDPMRDPTRWEKFCQRHGINPNLIMLKITLFVMYGATSSLLPYLTIHMQSTGLTVEEIAIIYLALPFTTFLSPPITGFLVDKFGRYKPVVIMSLLLNALFHHSLLLIPQQEIPGKVPEAYVMRHPGTGNVEVWWSPCPSRECPEEEEIDIVVDQCLDHCLLQEQNPKIELAPPPTDLPLVVTPIGVEPNDPKDDLDLYVQNKGKGNKNKTADVLSTSSSSSTTELYIDKSLLKEVPEESEESEEGWVVAGSGDSAFIVLDMHPDLGEPIEQLGMEIEHDDNATVTDFKTRFGVALLWKQGVNVTALEEEDLRCGGLVMTSNMTLNSNIKLSEWAADCMVQRCRFRRNGPDICPPDYKESDDKIFWIYFALRFLATTMLSAGVTIMDPIALTMIEKYGGDFGRERLFSSIGMAIFSPITGVLIDLFSKDLGYTDYSAAFYTYDILLIISSVTVFLMPLGEKLPADNVFKDLWNLLKLKHVIIFIWFLFLLGNFWGFIESFLFLYLKELGAPNYLLGITITVGTVSSIPFLYGAGRITKIVGHVNLIVIAFIAHACRLVGYSFIENAWWCFPFEAMEALSCHLMWVAAATYCALLAPKSLLATLIGVLGMAHFSLGRGSGSFFGGFLISEVGTREAFRYMGLVAVAGGLAYKFIHSIWLRKYDNLDADEEAVEKGEAEKLYTDGDEPKTKDQGTSMSQERLSLMIKYNQIGSLTSLPRGSRGDVNDVFAKRRSSYNIEFVRAQKGGGSASKVDLLKSAVDINHKASQQHLRKEGKASDQSLNSKRADSAPRLNQSKNISQPTLSAVVDEVCEMARGFGWDLPSSVLSRHRKKHHQSGILVVKACSQDGDLDLRNYLRETEQRDSITEGEEENYKLELSKKASRGHVLNDIPERTVEAADGTGSAGPATPAVVESTEPVAAATTPSISDDHTKNNAS